MLALGVAVAALGLFSAPSGAETANGKVLVASSACFPVEFVYRPHRFGISCDATLSFRDIHWQTYGGAFAVGHGIARTQGCDPDCAEGEVRLLKVTVKLSKVVSCGGRRIYAHLWFRIHGNLIPGFVRQAQERMIATNEFGEPTCAEASSAGHARNIDHSRVWSMLRTRLMSPGVSRRRLRR